MLNEARILKNEWLGERTNKSKNDSDQIGFDNRATRENEKTILPFQESIEQALKLKKLFD